jgi:transcriptional regulator with GAF, ATPase, and Fis domain
MNTSTEAVSVQRRRLWQWGLTSTLLLVLATTVGIWAWFQENLAGPVLWAEGTGRTAAVGLVGMTVLFVLQSHREQHRLADKEKRIQWLSVRESLLTERLSEVSSLFEIATDIAHEMSPDSILSLTARRVRRCVEADYCSIFLYDPVTGLLDQKAAHGRGSETEPKDCLVPQEGVVGLAYETGEPELISGERARRFAQELSLVADTVSAVCVPLRFKKTSIGIVAVSRNEGNQPFSQAHVRALSIFARNLATVFVKTYDYERRLRDRKSS